MRTTLDIVIESDTSYRRAPKKKLYKYEELLNKYGQLIEKDGNELPYPSVFYPADRWNRQARIVIADRDWTHGIGGCISDVLI